MDLLCPTLGHRNSGIEILQKFQNKYLRIILSIPWYVTKLYTMISTYHTLETKLKDSARDTPTE